MKATIVTPVKAILSDYTSSELARLTSLLTYKNTSEQFLYNKHQRNFYSKKSNPIWWERRLIELRNNITKVLVFKDEDGNTYIRPGSLPYLKDLNIEVENQIVYPTPKVMPWAKVLPFELHDYQKESVRKLIEEKHGNVELTTGSGKSSIILKVCRETGFRTAIVAPSKSIFLELLDKFELHLGRGQVGRFGDGKKVLGKRLTVCISDSLTNVKPGSKEWEFFSNLQMAVFDESHSLAAETLEEVCNGVFANTPYRLMLSATQTRGDGGDKLLESIIGRTVHILSTKDAVAGGYICPHEFKIVSVRSSNPNLHPEDALENKRVHLLRNTNIGQFIAKLTNTVVTHKKEQVLILVEELSQIAMLLPMIKVPVAIAHSETKKERLLELNIEKVDPAESVEKFNKGEVKVLIGTSCVSTGTNIFQTNHTVNWVGGASEIKTKQGAVGRSVRLHSHNPWASKMEVQKVKATIWDFDVIDLPEGTDGRSLMEKHLDKRIEFYKESGSTITKIKSQL